MPLCVCCRPGVGHASQARAAIDWLVRRGACVLSFGSRRRAHARLDDGHVSCRASSWRALPLALPLALSSVVLQDDELCAELRLLQRALRERAKVPTHSRQRRARSTRSSRSSRHRSIRRASNKSRDLSSRVCAKTRFVGSFVCVCCVVDGRALHPQQRLAERANDRALEAQLNVVLLQSRRRHKKSKSSKR